MDLSLIPHTKTEYEQFYFGPLSEKKYEELKEFFDKTGIGYSAIKLNKTFTLMVSNRQLLRYGIVLQEKV